MKARRKEPEVGLCRKCRSPAEILPPGRGKQFDPLMILALWALWFSNTEAFHTVGVLILLGVMGLVPSLWFFYYWGTSRLDQKTVVICASCGTTRIGADSDPEEVRRFHRRRRLVRSMNAMLLPAFLFLVATVLVRRSIEGVTDPATGIVLLTVSVAFLDVRGIQWIYLPAPRHWWQRFWR